MEQDSRLRKNEKVEKGSNHLMLSKEYNSSRHIEGFESLIQNETHTAYQFIKQNKIESFDTKKGQWTQKAFLILCST